ncbi:MAG: hypothetical protein ACT4O4_04405 [Nitrospiraceae bacterium]
MVNFSSNAPFELTTADEVIVATVPVVCTQTCTQQKSMGCVRSDKSDWWGLKGVAAGPRPS